MYCLSAIRSALAEYRPERFEPGPHTRQAAVAVILCPQIAEPQTLQPQPDGEVSILFIKRAQNRGDPWSGHMAFPGGHREPADRDNRAAAERETLEEIGLDLAHADYLGALDQQRAMARGRSLDMIIEPHVYALDRQPVVTPNFEVDEVVWTALTPLVRNLRHATETRPMAGTPTVFNGYRLERGHFVWGLTYRMLKTLFAALDPHWQPPDRD